MVGRGRRGIAPCACCAPEVQAVTARVTGALTRRGFLACAAVTVSSLELPDLAAAQSAPVPADPGRATLLTNLRLFDGTAAGLRDGLSVLVRGERIAALAPAATAPPEGALVVDCGGRTVMPGLIDPHWHTMMASLPLAQLMTAEVGFIHLAAAAEAERTLLRGFTTVRDLGGPAFALKRAIDAGLISGPRIYPSGAIISQTAGHGDFRNTYEVPRIGGAPSRAEALGAATVADGAEEVRRRTREQLMAGATQVKLAAGGGVASTYDPLDVLQYRPEELRAAVEAAADWGTYVAAHVYMPEGIRRCVEAGVKSIEHGQLADEESVRRMAGAGVRWSMQPFTREMNANADRLDPARLAKWELVWGGTDRSYELAIRHGLVPAFGTDALFDPAAAVQQGVMLAAMRRWYTPAQALRIATAENAALLAMSGPRDAYPGKLGVIEAAAFADLLVVDGDPLEDLGLFADPGRSLGLVMKGGRIHKNTLAA